MPEVYNNPDIDKETYIKSYINTYIEKDIRELLGVSKLLAFKKFVVSVASGIVYLLESYMSSELKRLIHIL